MDLAFVENCGAKRARAAGRLLGRRLVFQCMADEATQLVDCAQAQSRL
jgi:hypothetical protein